MRLGYGALEEVDPGLGIRDLVDSGVAEGDLGGRPDLLRCVQLETGLSEAQKESLGFGQASCTDHFEGTGPDLWGSNGQTRVLARPEMEQRFKAQNARLV